MFLVIADTYTGGYGTELTLFGIFPTKEEAVSFIINNPVQKVYNSWDGEETYDFFRYYDEYKVQKIYEAPDNTHPEQLQYRLKEVGERIVPKEEYALNYIKEFTGTPLCIGMYIE